MIGLHTFVKEMDKLYNKKLLLNFLAQTFMVKIMFNIFRVTFMHLFLDSTNLQVLQMINYT